MLGIADLLWAVVAVLKFAFFGKQMGRMMGEERMRAFGPLMALWVVIGIPIFSAILRSDRRSTGRVALQRHPQLAWRNQDPDRATSAEASNGRGQRRARRRRGRGVVRLGLRAEAGIEALAAS